MNNNIEIPRPVFKGLSWCNEQYYSFFVPIDWRRVERSDGKEGIIYVPTRDDSHTFYAVQIDNLGTPVTSEDIPDLVQGLLNGIHQQNDSRIETQTHSTVGKLVELEARFTFLEGTERRKRWVRVLYHENRQVTFIAQGSTEQVFHYWLPMFYEAMMTLKVHSTKPTIPS
jgi:hypothetical protein